MQNYCMEWKEKNVDPLRFKLSLRQLQLILDVYRRLVLFDELESILILKFRFNDEGNESPEYVIRSCMVLKRHLNIYPELGRDSDKERKKLYPNLITNNTSTLYKYSSIYIIAIIVISYG